MAMRVLDIGRREDNKGILAGRRMDHRRRILGEQEDVKEGSRRIPASAIPLRQICDGHAENTTNNQADQYTTGEEAAAKKASRSFKKYSYRGVELDQLLDLSNEKFIDVSVPSSGKDRAYLYLSCLAISTFCATHYTLSLPTLATSIIHTNSSFTPEPEEGSSEDSRGSPWV
jgi:small subunit ribosomal protein S15e